MVQLKPAPSASTALQPQPLNEPSPRFDAPRDGQEVAAELRRLVPMARRAIRPEPNSGADLRCLAAVHAGIVDLEAAVARLGPTGLLDYVAALRRRVESALPPSTVNGRANDATHYPTKF